MDEVPSRIISEADWRAICKWVRETSWTKEEVEDAKREADKLKPFFEGGSHEVRGRAIKVTKAWRNPADPMSQTHRSDNGRHT